MDFMVRTAMTIEKEIDNARSIRDKVLVTRGWRVNLFLVWERSRRLLFYEDFRDRAATIRAKARSGLLAS